MHLDRDDVGNREDADGDEISINREMVIIRKKVAGEYIVNAHSYVKMSNDPIPVSVKIIKFSPKE